MNLEPNGDVQLTFNTESTIPIQEFFYHKGTEKNRREHKCGFSISKLRSLTPDL